jgi:hypothetical protein
MRRRTSSDWFNDPDKLRTHAQSHEQKAERCRQIGAHRLAGDWMHLHGILIQRAQMIESARDELQPQRRWSV